MSDMMRIDPDQVKAAAEAAMDVAEELDTAAVAVGGSDTDLLAAELIGPLAARSGLASAAAWWVGRVHDHRLRIDDLAQFMATTAVNAESYDAEDGSDIVEFESDLDDISDYSSSDYYEATGTERPTYNPNAVPTVGGEDVATA
jgi:hypothetical protein